MIAQTLIFAVLLLIMWTIVILLVWHDGREKKKGTAMKDNDLISRSAAKDEILSWAAVINKPHLLSKDDTLHVLDTLPAVDAEEVVRCKDCKLWDMEHIEMHSHSAEHPEQQAEFAECRKWSTWSTCFMTRSDDYCSQAKMDGGADE